MHRSSRAVIGRDTGVVDEDVDFAQLGDGAPDLLPSSLVIGYVEDEPQRAPPEPLDRLDCREDAVMQLGDHHVGAIFGQDPRRGLAQTPRRAGH